MKITIKSDNKNRVFKVSVEIPDDSDIHEVLNKIRDLLVGYGFHPISVDAGFKECEPFNINKLFIKKNKLERNYFK